MLAENLEARALTTWLRPPTRTKPPGRRIGRAHCANLLTLLWTGDDERLRRRRVVRDPRTSPTLARCLSHSAQLVALSSYLTARPHCTLLSHSPASAVSPTFKGQAHLLARLSCRVPAIAAPSRTFLSPTYASDRRWRRSQRGPRGSVIDASESEKLKDRCSRRTTRCAAMQKPRRRSCAIRTAPGATPAPSGLPLA